MEILYETEAVKLTLVGVSLTIILLSAEYIFSIHNNLLDNDSLFSWEVASLRYGWMYKGWPIKFLNKMYHKKVFLWIIYIRLLLCSLMIIFIRSNISDFLFILLFLIFTSLLINIRHAHGRDGADEMINILLAGIASYVLIKNNSLKNIGPIFIVAQLTLSYFISGVYKLFSKTWQSGDAITQVLSTQIYGNPKIVGILTKKYIKLFLAWSVIIWETSFPLIWITTHPYNIAWIIFGIFFHMSIAIIMGLNTFLLAFLSAYPILYFYVRN